MEINRPLKKNKIRLLGTAYSLAEMQWSDDYDYWACGSVVSHDYGCRGNIDLIFEMHQDASICEESIKKYILSHNCCSVVRQAKTDERSIAYPLHDIQLMVVDTQLATYFTSTMAYMIALAIYQGYERIELWGIHLSEDDEEYSMQRCCVESWLSYAIANRINVWVHPESAVLTCKYLYGYEDNEAILLKLMNRRQGIQLGLSQLESELRQKSDHVMRQRGGLDDVNALIKQYKRGMR